MPGKVYTFTLTAGDNIQAGLYGGRRSSRNADFSGYGATNTTRANAYCHIQGGYYQALIMDFRQANPTAWAHIATLPTSQIISITMDWTLQAAPSYASGQWRIGARLYNDNNDWTIGSDSVTGYYVKSKVQTTAELTSLGFNTLGYVIGAANGDGASNQNISSVTLTITTNEPPTLTASFNSVAETSISIHVDASEAISTVYYSFSAGAEWSVGGTPGTASFNFTLSGLDENQEYNIRIKVVSASTGLESSEWAHLNTTTYSFPCCTAAPNFVIGQSVTLALYNPLGRSVTVRMNGNGSTIKTVTTTGTSVSGFNSQADVAALYASIPAAVSAEYNVEVTYGSETRETRLGSLYSVDTTANRPTVSGLTYRDTNATAIALTEDNQQIIRNLSTPLYTAAGVGARNAASVASVVLSVNGESFELTLSGTTATGGDRVINSAANVVATVTVTDSRGLTATATVTVQMMDWTQPSAQITMRRLDGFYTPTTLNVDAIYSTLGGLNTVSITYKLKQAGAYEWAITGTASDNVPVTVQADNEYAWDVQIVVADRLAATTYNLTLPRGMPIVFFDRVTNAMGINAFPAAGETLRVGGNATVTGTLKIGNTTLTEAQLQALLQLI